MYMWAQDENSTTIGVCVCVCVCVCGHEGNIHKYFKVKHTQMLKAQNHNETLTSAS